MKISGMNFLLQVVQTVSLLLLMLMPHLPQVRPSRGCGGELVPRFCPEGWEFVLSLYFVIIITLHNATVNDEVHIHIEVINFPLLEVATLCIFHCSLQSLLGVHMVQNSASRKKLRDACSHVFQGRQLE